MLVYDWTNQSHERIEHDQSSFQTNINERAWLDQVVVSFAEQDWDVACLKNSCEKCGYKGIGQGHCLIKLFPEK